MYKDLKAFVPDAPAQYMGPKIAKQCPTGDIPPPRTCEDESGRACEQPKAIRSFRMSYK